MGKLNIFEPHPTVAQNTYTYSGRGGAGNAFRAPVTTPASGVAYPSTKPKSSTRFYSGRGGAGNAQAASQAQVFSFDEEFSRAETREKSAAAAYTGRGGAGNIYTNKPRKESDASSRRDSSSTTGSVRAGFWGRISGTSMASQ